MSDWPVGLSTGCFYRQSILECLEPILRSGFSLLEICSYPQHLDYHDLTHVRAVSERMKQLGVDAFSFHAPFADHIDITAPDAVLRADSLREVLSAAAAASLLGVRHFVIHPGPERAGTPLDSRELQTRRENVAASLSEIADYCAAQGMLCVLENKLPHLMFGNTADMLWILALMTSTNVGVCLDTGHARLAGELEVATQKLSGHLKMVHASDNLGKFDDHLPPGRGTINWPHFLEHLTRSAFHGSIILEIAAQSDVSNTLAEARAARQFLRHQAWRLRLG